MIALVLVGFRILWKNSLFLRLMNYFVVVVALVIVGMLELGMFNYQIAWVIIILVFFVGMDVFLIVNFVAAIQRPITSLVLATKNVEQKNMIRLFLLII